MSTFAKIQLIVGLAAISTLGAQEKPAAPVPQGDASKTKIIRIFESGKPKPVGVVPTGWSLAVVSDRKIEHPPVKLPTGKVSKLSSQVYILVPDKGRTLFVDPLFDPAKGNQQTRTIGASLTAFIESQAALQRSLTELTDGLHSQIKALPASSDLPAKAGKPTSGH